MRKNILPAAMAVILSVFALISCQKAPDAAEGNGIMHAQGELERQVQEIAGADAQGQNGTGGDAGGLSGTGTGTGADTGGSSGTGAGGGAGTGGFSRTDAGAGTDARGQIPSGTGTQGAGRYQGTVGTGVNIININAEIPGIQDNLYVITLQPDDGLDKDVLMAFLDSESGSVKDTSQELLREIGESDQYNSTLQENGDRFLYSKFGDHSALRLESGTKEASFTGHTGAYYVDHALMEKCQGIFGGNYSETLIAPDKMGEGSFSAQRAREILLDKLGVVGVSDIAFERIYYVEGNGYSYYQMYFIPVREGLTVDIGSNSYALGQVRPDGWAEVSPDGVAEVSLNNFCGKTVRQDPVTALSFEQVLKILEQYLDGGMIESDGRITYDRVELNYYPVPTAPALDGIEYKSELVLTPMWHIYVPIDEYVDSYGDAVGPSHICVNAVTGELINTD